MSLSDPLSDLLTRIRNGQHAGKTVVESPVSNAKVQVLEVLKREGFIRGYSVDPTQGYRTQLKIELKYHEGQPVIKEITRVSKPGRRVYTGVKEMPRVYGGLGIAIVSTPKGVMSDNEARELNVGGEVICRVF